MALVQTSSEQCCLHDERRESDVVSNLRLHAGQGLLLDLLPPLTLQSLFTYDRSDLFSNPAASDTTSSLFFHRNLPAHVVRVLQRPKATAIER